MRVHADLIIAGFRRYSTYRQAMLAGATTNVVFGLLRLAILAAALTAANGAIGEYDIAASTTYVWLGQGLIGFVALWGHTAMSERIRSGDIVVDLYRPWDLHAAQLAEDVGRAGYAFLVRFLPPVAFGALFFPFQWPENPAIWLAFPVSMLLGLLGSFGLRFLLNLSTFWLLDNRGMISFYSVTSGALCGLVVPISFYPDWARVVLWCTPFPAILQGPIDVFLGHVDPWLMLGYQAFWAVALYAAGHLLLGHAVRKVVIQGG